MFHDRWLIERLLRTFEREGRHDAAQGVRNLVAEAIHPLGGRGWNIGKPQAEALAPVLLGGAGGVMRAGDRAPLGPTRACQTVQVHVTTRCLVTIELWMPFATMPCGSWNVNGPGSTPVDLTPNETLAGRDVVGPDDFGVVVAFGRDGEFPALITFGP